MLTIPSAFQEILSQDARLSGAVTTFAAAVGTLVEDNKLPFFPHYTDHGPKHLEQVLATEQRLIPVEVLKAKLLTPADMAVLICGTLLHDIAMHVREPGFLALVHGKTSHRPIDWFDRKHEDHEPDLPWSELWEAYQLEMSRFGDRQLNNILGPKPKLESIEWSARELPKNPQFWDDRDRLLIGEFLRRHHGRLAHEIAVYGFPGAENAGFELPTLSKIIPKLGSLAGLVARSHGMSLRLCLEALRSKHSSVLRPYGTVPVYHMALLRVADYLQVDADRAPPILLQLRDPQSPVSVDEWNKHGAVEYISYDHADPYAVHVQLNTKHALSTHLQMQDLLTGLQDEMDKSSAVLAETYGRAKAERLDQLRLAKSNVRSNINEPAFQESLPYLPVRGQLTSDPHLLTLLAGPLYGDHPEIGVRELLQNAVDSVREREQFCKNHGISEVDLDLPFTDCEVLVELKSEGQRHQLVVTDNGIGMTPATVQNYFLRAGASFRDSPTWKSEFTDSAGDSTVLRSGKFGIGAFAIHLLGTQFTVRTRHVCSRRSEGSAFSVTNDSQFIELRRANLPVGTRIEVEITPATAGRLRKTKLGEWYCLSHPRVRLIVNDQIIKQVTAGPNKGNFAPGHWTSIRTPEYPAVFWTYSRHPSAVCNGIRVAAIDTSRKKFGGKPMVLRGATLGWSNLIFSKSFRFPNISIFDPSGNLPLSLRRDQFTSVPTFERPLREDCARDFVAYSLVFAPSKPVWSCPDSSYIQKYRGAKSAGCSFLRWFCNRYGVGVSDPSILRGGGFSHMFYCGSASGPWSWAPRLPLGNDTACILSPIKPTITQRALIEAIRVSQMHNLEKGWARHVGSESSRLAVLVDPYVLLPESPLHGSRELSNLLNGAHHDRELGIITRAKGAAAAKYLKTQNFVRDAPRRHLFPYATEVSLFDSARYKEKSSTLAEVWFATLGQALIPFDSRERAEMIIKAEEKPSMKRRLAYWRQQKANEVRSRVRKRRRRRKKGSEILL